MLSFEKEAPAERPIVFMPRKFWAGELPTATVNCFSDPVLGLKGIDVLLASINKAISKAGKKDYTLFNRFVESRFKAVSWEIEGPAIKGVGMAKQGERTR